MIKLNNSEKWQVPDLPDSLRSKAQNYQNRLSSDFPELTYGSFVLVPDGTRILIDDISQKRDRSDIVLKIIDQLSQSCVGLSCMVDISALSVVLERQLIRELWSLEEGVVVGLLPGRGAGTVKDFLSVDLGQTIRMQQFAAERIIDETGRITGVRTNVERLDFDVRPSAIVVIDDVIATGTTAVQSRKLCGQQAGCFFAAPLMMLSPIQNRQYEQNRGLKGGAGLDGFARVITPIVYQGQSGIPPVNSLSTLISTDVRGEAVRDSFIRKYVVDENVFNDSIRQLQKRR